MMSQHAITNITVGYKFLNKNNNYNLVDLIFRDWIYNHCSASVDHKRKEITLPEDEYVWLIIAYPTSTLSKYVSIEFDSFKKEFQDGYINT